MTRDAPLWVGLAAVGSGAVLGAWLRWGLGVALNARWPALPPGTLASNVVGGYLVGVMLGIVAAHPGLAPAWRLFVITGFLGGLTTFSTFSAESLQLLAGGQWSAALLHTLVHVSGSLAAAALGPATVRWLA